MNQAWLSLIPSLSPLLVGALVFAEVAAYFGSRGFLRVLVFTGLVVFALLTIFSTLLSRLRMPCRRAP